MGRKERSLLLIRFCQRDHVGARIAEKDYDMLFVERGTVIFATKKFRMLSFREILQLHGIVDVDRVVGTNPSVGDWENYKNSHSRSTIFSL